MSITEGTKPLRVLVVDDHEPTGEAIAFLISTNRHQVVTCSCSECPRQVAEFRPHAVVLDIDTSETNGCQAAAWIRQQAELSQPLIIGLTRSIEDYRRHASATGINAWLAKPVQQRLLQRVLDEI